MFKIEKDIPIPEDTPKKGLNARNGSYSNLLQMEPGDSVFFEGLDRQKAYHKVYYGVVYHYKKPWQFTARDEADGARVWRTK